jgi:hypothetical protein
LDSYLRFVTPKLDIQSGRRQGLFYAAYELEAAGAIVGDPFEELAALHAWFAKNMQEPSRAARSSRPHRKGLALSWFKETAVAHVSNMRRMQLLLETHGVFAELLKTARPGYIVYEDEHQILAYPFADTPT